MPVRIRSARLGAPPPGVDFGAGEGDPPAVVQLYPGEMHSFTDFRPRPRLHGPCRLLAYFGPLLAAVLILGAGEAQAARGVQAPAKAVSAPPAQRVVPARWPAPGPKSDNLQLSLATARKRTGVAWGIWGGSYLATGLTALAVGLSTWEAELAYIYIPGYGPFKAAAEVDNPGIKTLAVVTGLIRLGTAAAVVVSTTKQIQLERLLRRTSIGVVPNKGGAALVASARF